MNAFCNLVCATSQHTSPCLFCVQVPIKRRNYTLLTSKSSNQQEQPHAASEHQQQEQQQQQYGSWADAYADPRLPLAVDVGCGAGRFLLLLARKDADCKCNYLGLDIQPAVSMLFIMLVKAKSIKDMCSMSEHDCQCASKAYAVGGIAWLASDLGP